MRATIIFLIVFASVATLGQSRRVPPTGTSPTAVLPSAAEATVKQMFDEANGYIRAKAAEFDLKRVEFSDSLFKQTKLEQRQLAAKYAAKASQRKDLTADDRYYLGMLHWIAENLDGTLEALQKFIASDSPEAGRRQTARSVVTVVLAKQKKMPEAEAVFAEYLKNEPTKLTERSRIGGEMAKAYQTLKDFKKMAPHADAGYTASKGLLSDATSRSRGLDEILDAGMLVYEAYRDSGEQKKADDALEDMRATAAEFEAPSFYYYAVDQKIKFMIETGRKPAAIAYYAAALSSADKDLRAKTSSADVVSRLKKREKHYKLLGEIAPELPLADQWFPGDTRTLATYKGKVVLLDFWATWCVPCFEAFPSLIEWHQDFNRDGFEILGITRYYGTVNGLPADNPSEAIELKRFRQRERLPYDFVVMKDQSAQNLYGATALPTAVLIDRKGVVRYIEAGTSSARIGQMREMLGKLLAEK
ncbi:MAG: TlpA disulfide reductase family protein [Pyrinomonadaceae bacterium]